MSRFLKNVLVLSLVLFGLAQPLFAQAANLCNFSRNLALGSKGADVRSLQQFLNQSTDTRVAVSGTGSSGHESLYFGLATKNALIKYQNKFSAEILTPSGLKKGTGYFGASTRRFINTSCLNAPSSTIVKSTSVGYSGPATITFNSINVNNVQVGNKVSFTVQAEQPQNHTFVYSLTNPPANSNFNPLGGTFSWIPGSTQVGQYDLNFTAVDGSTGETAKFTKTINVSLTPVVATDQIPTITVQAPTSVTTVPISAGTYVAHSNYSTTPIYSWAQADPSLSNISPFVWVSQYSLKNNINDLKAQFLAKPAGQRVMLSWDLTDDLAQDPADICPQGIQSTPHCIWWDNGIATTTAIVNSAFSKLSAAGVPIDLIITDFEKSLDSWSLSGNQYAATFTDPRFAPILAQLSAFGWPSGDSMDSSGRFQSDNDRYIWNELMYERVAGYLNQSVFAQARKYYPNIDGANYNYFYHNPQYPVPDPNNAPIYRYGQGAIFGTGQSPVMYGYINGISDSIQVGNQFYGSSPFAAFKYDMNVLRSAKLSSPAPLLPWFSFKGFSSDSLAHSDLYQEMVFHTLLTGVKGLLYWDPPQSGATGSDDQIMSYAAQEFDSVAGFPGAQTVVSQLIPWGSDYVLSGMKNGSQVIWRFTPDLSGGKTLASTLVSQSNNQVVVKTASAQLTFPNATIVSGVLNTSAQGYWIAQTGNPQVNGGLASSGDTLFAETASVFNALGSLVGRYLHFFGFPLEW